MSILKLKSIATAMLIGVATQCAMANTVDTTMPDCNISAGVEHLFTMTATTVSSCLYAGGGNINGVSFADDVNMLNAGWTFVTDPGAIFSFTGLGSTSGTFTLSDTGDLYAIGLKSGENLDIDHAIFGLAAHTTSGSWTISPEQGGALSHMILWTKDGGGGGGGGGDAPEPATLALVGLALAAAGVAGKRKSRG
jgi:hypothetical protein